MGHNGRGEKQLSPSGKTVAMAATTDLQEQTVTPWRSHDAGDPRRSREDTRGNVHLNMVQLPVDIGRRRVFHGVFSLPLTFLEGRPTMLSTRR
jgi:hypothetical protein